MVLSEALGFETARGRDDSASQKQHVMGVPVGSGSLEAALDGMFGSSASDESHRLRILGAPAVLVVHLKRFGVDESMGRRMKLTSRFEFPQVLSRWGRTYALAGVVNHKGDPDRDGHYYSVTRDNSREGCWVRHDDENATAVVDFETLLEAECFGGPPDAPVAMLLFYTSCDVGHVEVAPQSAGAASIAAQGLIARSAVHGPTAHAAMMERLATYHSIDNPSRYLAALLTHPSPSVRLLSVRRYLATLAPRAKGLDQLKSVARSLIGFDSTSLEHLLATAHASGEVRSQKRLVFSSSACLLTLRRHCHPPP